MKLLVNAGFSQPLDPRFVEPCRYIAQGNRTGPACNDHHEPLAAIVRDSAKYFTTAVFVVAGWDWRRDDGVLYQRRDHNLLHDPGKQHFANQCRSIVAEWRGAGRRDQDCFIEIGNELDGSYWKENLDEFHELAMHCYHAVREESAGVGFISGSTMNFNKEPLWKKGGYEILEELCKLAWPHDTLQGLHPYRGDGRGWPSFESDRHVAQELLHLLRGRRLAITEMGWASHTGHSDDKIAAMAADELRMWRDFGAELFVHYQIQDREIPHNSGEGGFGAYTNINDGFQRKPVARILHGFLELMKT